MNNNVDLIAWFRVLKSNHVCANEKAEVQPILDRIVFLNDYLSRR